MARSNNNYSLKYFDTIKSRKVKWLWYPYIPYGKITIVQGDPGDGKTTFVLNLVARLTLGQPLPHSDKKSDPIVVVYQNAEDSVEDTIKPRLESIKADCSKVVYLEYDGDPMTLSDDRIEKAIIDSGAKLFVFDPLQAFIGDADMNRAGDIRALMLKLTSVADKTGCAVVLVGHMNKGTSGKGIYRGLGSIDIAAAARSVLLIGRIKGNSDIRAVVHIKSNLAPEGESLAFELSKQNGFKWFDEYDITQEELLCDAGTTDDSKLGEAIKVLSMLLYDKNMLATNIFEECKNAGIGVRTLKTAKNILGIKSIRHDGKWYWSQANIKGKSNG